MAQQEEGIAIARRAQRVVAPLLVFVLIALVAAVAWAWFGLRR